LGSLLELGAGFHPEFSGRDNLHMNAAILGIPKDEVRRRFDEVADFADIGDYIERPVRTYSSGMAMRLGFAVAMMANPDILILDEILAVGDQHFQKSVSIASRNCATAEPRSSSCRIRPTTFARSAIARCGSKAANR
jgi:ABC-type polysaccharide/polyol phosphate transport system ATPase subunit